jgi:hypothetical protein
MAESQKHRQTDKDKEPQKHSRQEAGHMGGVTAQQSGHAHQLTDEERSEGGKAAQESGHAHKLTSKNAQKGGEHSQQEKRSSLFNR